MSEPHSDPRDTAYWHHLDSDDRIIALLGAILTRLNQLSFSCRAPYLPGYGGGGGAGPPISSSEAISIDKGGGKPE